MARQIVYRCAMLIAFAVIAEIHGGSTAERFSRQHYHASKKFQNRGQFSVGSSMNLTRIVGGTDATIKEFPYQVSIKYNGLHLCGGTLIGWKRHHVLTAASCFVKDRMIQDPKDYHLVLRSSLSFVMESSAIIRRIKKVILHPRYDIRGLNDNNIAIIVLDKPVTQIQSAELESMNAFNRIDYDGKTATALGWGYEIAYLYNPLSAPKNNRYSISLKKVNLPVISRETCLAFQPKLTPTNPFDYTFGGKVICTGILENKGICPGDIGGPLLVDGIQIGVISKVFGCGDKNYPGLYTRIAAYREWINRRIEA